RRSPLLSRLKRSSALDGPCHLCTTRDRRVLVSRAQNGLERRGQTLDGGRTVEAVAVDEEGWSSVHSASHSAVEVALDALEMTVGADVLFDLLRFEAQRERDRFERFQAQRFRSVLERPGEDGVVRLPELALQGGALGELRGRLGRRMHFGQREVSEHEAKLGPERALQGA